jgi:hypothetical protein
MGPTRSAASPVYESLRHLPEKRKCRALAGPPAELRRPVLVRSGERTCDEAKNVEERRKSLGWRARRRFLGRFGGLRRGSSLWAEKRPSVRVRIE